MFRFDCQVYLSLDNQNTLILCCNVTNNLKNTVFFAGNGNIQLFRFEGKKKFVLNECLKKHSSSITQVHFARFRPNNLLVSGGDDSRIVAWNLCSSAGSGASGPEPNHAANGSAVSIAHEINHGSKINWITSGSQRESIFVADLTCDISLYHIL